MSKVIQFIRRFYAKPPLRGSAQSETAKVLKLKAAQEKKKEEALQAAFGELRRHATRVGLKHGVDPTMRALLQLIAYLVIRSDTPEDDEKLAFNLLANYIKILRDRKD